ncbi:ferrochelatase [Laceyella putida]|uniref:Coproporphyrin III ferrochelatase n=1 Tax=Laceyella putida TaxID=110101 RepID=A0ABW2RL04_9BACL
MKRKKIGVLLMAYGTPRNKEEIEPYYTHIRRGRKPPQELLDELTERYEAVGEINQFAKITEAQVEKVVAELQQRFPQLEFRGYLGLKHISPFVEEAVERMARDGIEEAVSLVLAPHYSTYSVKSYNERAQAKAKELDITLYSIDSWHDEPPYIQYWADRLKALFDDMDAQEKEKSVVIFSAHSLPEKILATGDPYPEQLQETAKLIAEKVSIPHYRMGWQSAGRTPEPWLGPDVQDLTRDLYQKEGFTSFIYCPIGFVAEHLEVLYDNDIECKAVTDELGANYYRPAMPNARPEFIACLSGILSKELIRKGVIAEE